MAPKKSKSAETFDGSLAVLPGDFKGLQDSQVFLANPLEWRPLTDPEKSFLGILSRKSSNLREKLSGIQVAHDFSELLMEGRLKLHYVLNTHGGRIIFLWDHENLIEHVRNHGGQISAIGGRCVESAGAGLFLSTDPERRYLLPESELMFHLSSTVSDPECIYDNSGLEDLQIDGMPVDDLDDDAKQEYATFERGQQIANLRRRLLPSLKRTYRGKIGKLIDSFPKEAPRRGEEADNCSIIFSGKEAAQAGLCKLTKDPLVTFAKLSGIPWEKLRGSLNDILESMAYMPEENEQFEEIMDRVIGMFGHGKT